MIKIGLFLLIIGLFFYQKVSSHANLLDSPYDKIYKVLDTVFDLLTRPFMNINPINIGRGVKLDVAPFIVLIILLGFMILVSRGYMNYTRF
ncbi:YggT family protein [Halosquirtibacter xylanolyticus]|nr:YggT family protein [Prolixibacteraceae bacterium]